MDICLAVLFLIYLLYEWHYTNGLERIVSDMAKHIDNLTAKVEELDKAVKDNRNENDGK